MPIGKEYAIVPNNVNLRILTPVNSSFWGKLELYAIVATVTS
jgi:hypothetical protein